MIGIYKIENLITHQVYIGQSINIERRWKCHLVNYTNPNSKAYSYPLYIEMREYGIDNFAFEILEECNTDMLNQREIYWIEYYDSFFNGYNQSLGGVSSGIQCSKKQLIGIINDLEQTSLTQKAISIKWNISEEMVQGINTGRYWFHSRTYPIRLQDKKINYCQQCGCQITSKATLCQSCYKKIKSQHLPSKNELEFLLINFPLTHIAQKYNVSDNAVRKWCKKYNLPSKKKDIEEYFKKSA